MRPKSAKFHFQMLLLSGIVIALSVLLSPDPGNLEIFGMPIPALCAYRIFLGFECLGCGLTRSFTYMGHFDLAMAWEMNRIGPFLWSFIAAQIPYRTFRLFLKRGEIA